MGPTMTIGQLEQLELQWVSPGINYWDIADSLHEILIATTLCLFLIIG